MRKLICFWLIFNMAIPICGASSADTKELMEIKQNEITLQQEIKDKAHAMAECARDLGEDETGIVITASKEYWHTAHATQNNLQKEYEKLNDLYQTELQQEQGQKAKGRYLGRFKITAYTPSVAENGGYTITATGKPLAGNEWSIVAVDPNVISLGSTLYIEGVGNVSAQDTGGAIKGNKLDLLVGYGEANDWGIQYRDVYIKN